MKLVFSWDDGALEDQKLFELHERYEIPGMFFVPTRNREGREVLSPELIKNAESKYIQFGGHTDNHTYLTEIPLEKVEDEIRKNKEYLENTLGHGIDHFCLPGGKYNEAILEIVSKYYKTIRTADTMSFFNEGKLIKPSVHFYPRGVRSLIGNAIRQRSIHLLPFLLKNRKMAYFELISKIVEIESKRSNSLVMIWGHSWEIEELALWNELDYFLNTIKDLYFESIGCYNDYSIDIRDR